ncbi:MAG: hypothetical protein RLZZ584_2697 [Pseudomonadota bacterium]|jgi:hypothetical protein
MSRPVAGPRRVLALMLALAVLPPPGQARAAPAPAAPVASGASPADCGDELPAQARHQLVAGATRLVFAPRGLVEVGRHFALDVRVCASVPGPAAPLAPPLLKVDADMPAHRHGMNYRASVTPGARPGSYLVEGLMLHMPGRWRFIFELGGPAPQRLLHEVEVP